MKCFNTNWNKRDYKLFVVLAIVALAGWTQTAHARVSLSSIDAKLDALLAAQSIDLNNRVELSYGYTPARAACDHKDYKAYLRIHPDGTHDSTEFVVPAGHTLLILEVQWRAIPTPVFMANGSVHLVLTSSEADGISQFSQFYISPPLPTTSANTSTYQGTNETLIMGTAVGEGRIICGKVTNKVYGYSSTTHEIESSTLRGILVANE